MALVFVGMLGTALFGAVALRWGRLEFETRGHLSGFTFFALFAAYSNLTVCILLAAWWSVWPLYLPSTTWTMAGGVLIASGAGLYAAARIRFWSLRLTWGLSLDRLETSGVYRFSQNPQTAGALMFLMGVALLGRSGAALVLVLLYGAGCLMWIRIEERSLERRFGGVYGSYRAQVPRFFRLRVHRRREEGQ